MGLDQQEGQEVTKGDEAVYTKALIEVNPFFSHKHINLSTVIMVLLVFIVIVSAGKINIIKQFRVVTKRL